MKPSEVAQLTGIAASTIRAWTLGEFKQFFSPGAQGGEGRNRNMTETDARIVAFIAREKQRGALPDEIQIALRRMEADNWEGLPALPESTSSGFKNVPVVPKSQAESVLSATAQALLREIADLRQRLDEANVRIDSKDVEIRTLAENLAAAERELELWRSGRLKPEDDE